MNRSEFLKRFRPARKAVSPARAPLDRSRPATGIFTDTEVILTGKVVRITNFGAFVELAEGIEGLIHVSEFDAQAGGDAAELKVDETIKMRVIKLSPSERKIGLSIRALKSDSFEGDWQSYARSDSPEVTLGDHFKQQTSSD